MRITEALLLLRENKVTKVRGTLTEVDGVSFETYRLSVVDSMARVMSGDREGAVEAFKRTEELDAQFFGQSKMMGFFRDVRMEVKEMMEERGWWPPEDREKK